MDGPHSLKEVETDIIEDAETHKAIIVLWAVIMFFAFFLSFLKMGLLSAYITEPSWIYIYDRGVTAFIVIAFVKLWLSLIHPFYRVFAARLFKTYAAAKESWRFLSYIIWISVFVAVVFYVGGYQNLALSVGLVSAAFVYVLQMPILNAIGWMYISYSRVFRIGDRIQINDKKGDVVDITIMHTKLREINNWIDGDILTGRIISVPNRNAFDGSVMNYTSQSQYIWDSVKVSVTYESNQEKAKKIILEEIKKVVGEEMQTVGLEVMKMADFPELANRFLIKPMVTVTLADSSVVMEGIYACKSYERARVHSDITEGILKRFSEESDVNIAYPHMHIVGDAK